MSKVIAHMCENFEAEPGAAILSADIPQRIRFNTVAERIVYMADVRAMVGEQEIKATAEVLGRKIIVLIDGSTHESKYGPEISSIISQQSLRKQSTIVRLLLKAGADPSSLDKEGSTPLIEAQ